MEGFHGEEGGGRGEGYEYEYEYGSRSIATARDRCLAGASAYSREYGIGSRGRTRCLAVVSKCMARPTTRAKACAGASAESSSGEQGRGQAYG